MNSCAPASSRSQLTPANVRTKEAAVREEFAQDLSQAVLVCHLDMIVAVLNFLGIPHEEGFFAKDADVAGFLKAGWEQEAWNAFKDKYPPAVLLFYLNHLRWETLKSEDVYQPAA